MLEELRKLEAEARASLDKIGDGDWTPQDALLARVTNALPALLDVAEAAQRHIASRSIMTANSTDAHLSKALARLQVQ